MTEYPIDYDLLDQSDATGGGGHYKVSRATRRTFVIHMLDEYEYKEYQELVKRANDNR